ncbi:hypothetical protein SDC9_201317 [bioreactor metagenome]|uniref:Uncharacterized protein n=1 Tax=bioreactor metagenome TaxID=1076179 RepID=A0A645J2I6_9ZZZZ
MLHIHDERAVSSTYFDRLADAGEDFPVLWIKDKPVRIGKVIDHIHNQYRCLFHGIIHAFPVLLLPVIRV